MVLRYRHMNHRGLTLVLTSFLCGCTATRVSLEEAQRHQDEYDKSRGGFRTSYAQCGGRSPGKSDDTESVQAVIRTLVPGNLKVNCTDRVTFTSEGKSIDVVFVAFGEAQDCAAGCFSQHLCAIYDSPVAILYSQYGRNRSTPVPGINHPVTQTNDFLSFQRRQEDDDAPRQSWRFCFR